MVVAQRSGSFEAFYRRELVMLTSLARALVGDPALAADLAQEALLRAYRAWGSVGSYDNPGAWARRVLLNLVTDHRRRRLREAVGLARLDADVGVSNSFDTPADDELWAAVRALPPRQAEVVALRYVDDRAVDAIAAVLEISAGTVKATLFNARATLARQLHLEERHDAHD